MCCVVAPLSSVTLASDSANGYDSPDFLRPQTSPFQRPCTRKASDCCESMPASRRCAPAARSPWSCLGSQFAEVPPCRRGCDVLGDVQQSRGRGPPTAPDLRSDRRSVDCGVVPVRQAGRRPMHQPLAIVGQGIDRADDALVLRFGEPSQRFKHGVGGRLGHDHGQRAGVMLLPLLGALAFADVLDLRRRGRPDG